MSVWTRVKSEVLKENVNMEYFQEAIKELDLSLDFSKTEISNAYGKDKVNAMLRYQGQETALGIIINAKDGIDLVGDTWRSGIVGDKKHNTVANMMSQAYQAYKTKKQLELNGWNVVTTKKENKVVLECTQW